MYWFLSQWTQEYSYVGMKNDNEENDEKIPLAWEGLVIFLDWVIEWSGPFNISLKDTEKHQSQFSIKKMANLFLYAPLLLLNGKN